MYDADSEEGDDEQMNNGIINTSQVLSVFVLKYGRQNFQCFSEFVRKKRMQYFKNGENDREKQTESETFIVEASGECNLLFWPHIILKFRNDDVHI